ncbi:MAG: Fis family transcriptional regulator [Planctomycetes bacterium DG_23]|nr:MAG: Fis family transcriptional regulator [Planctomycetes bacterium DG_23]
MNPIAELLKEEGFLKTLFQSIPCGVLVVDGDRRVRAVNALLERTFGISEAKVVGKRGGEALRCIHAAESPQGCGYAEYCQSCVARNTALEALAGSKVYRRRAEVQLLIEGKVQDFVLLVSAAPLDYAGDRLAIVLLEDITELTRLRGRLKTEQSFAGIIGRDEKMLELFETIREVAEVSAPILIQGESGTGKELVAAAIHNEGPRQHKLFVPVNCSALPEGLLESELFGHVRGAFTGALRDKKGRFELADGGTIFLDEVGDLSGAIQVKLLRVLQEGTFERVGGEKTIKVDARIISATNKNLEREVATGRFRKDLFYRLCVVPVNLPPLRERQGDIPLLAHHILNQVLEETEREEVTLSREALHAMMDYDWPGNVRELQNAIQYALVKCRGNVLELEHLPPTLLEHLGQRKKPTKRRRRRKLNAAAVRRALEETGGNKVRAAKRLGVSRATLYRFLAETVI